MIELPDDELDKLFRKSSEELDPTFEPNDWSELKKRLDAEDGITPGGWWRKWWPIGVILLFLGGVAGSYFLFNRPDEKLTDNGEVSVNKGIVSDSVSGVVSNTKEKTKLPAAGQDAVAYGEIEVKRERAATQPDASTARNKVLPRHLSKAGGVHLEPDRFVGKGGDGAFSATAQADKRKSTGHIPEIRTKGLAGEKSAEQSDTKPADGVARERFVNTRIENGVLRDRKGVLIDRKPEERFPERRFPESKLETGQIGRLSGQADFTPALIGVEASEGLTVELAEPMAYKNKAWEQQTEIVVPEATASEVEVPTNEPSPFLAIRFGYSPDLSTVGLKNFSKPGSAFSILGELAIVPRLYLQAGVVRSVKEYSAGGSDYTFSKYVTDIATPDNVDGTCKMFEIPVGFRFDVLRMERSSLFAGTGMSSYYVQNEKYKYNYSKYVHGAKQGWEGSTGWFWLSHINASVGYEYKVAPRLSLLAEPYLRIPVKRVGYGKVNLTTTGVWISIRYVPVFR